MAVPVLVLSLVPAALEGAGGVMPVALPGGMLDPWPMFWLMPPFSSFKVF